MHKKCAVCGANHVDLHHTQAIGAGRNRNDILQLGNAGTAIVQRASHGEPQHRTEEFYGEVPPAGD